MSHAMDLFDEMTQEIDRLKVLLEIHQEMNAELRAAIRCERASGKCIMIHDPEREPCTRRTCHFMGVVDQRQSAGDGQCVPTKEET